MFPGTRRCGRSSWPKLLALRRLPGGDPVRGQHGLSIAPLPVTREPGARVAFHLDEIPVRRAARERLDSDRAAAGEQIDDPQSGKWLERHEQRLADAVRSRPGSASPWRLEAPASELSSYDAHRIA